MKALYPRPTALAQWLERAPQLSAGLSVAREGSRAEVNQLNESLPPHLRAHVASMRVNGSCLEILVRTPEAAHAARLERAILLAAARASGLKCNDFCARVQVGAPPARVPARQTNPAASAKLKDLADRVDSERMRTALFRLSRALER